MLAGARSAGFTLVELVVVIAIAAIVASIAGPRFFSNSTFDERRFADELGSALRYGQKVAVATGCPVRVSVAAGSYGLNQQAALAGHCDPADGTYASAVRLPDGQAVAGVVPGGIAMAPAASFRYLPTGQTDLAGDLVIAIGARTVSVNASSGLVVAQ